MPLTGIPSHELLLVLQVELNSNASAIPSDVGNGLLGHCILSKNPTIFQAMPGYIPFLPPDNPSPNPIQPASATSTQIQEINWLHLACLLLCMYGLYYHTVNKALVQQLLAATTINPLYVDTLSHPHHGFTGITCLHLLVTHLWTTYGSITSDALDANHTCMNAARPTAIKSLYSQLKCAAHFADTAGEATPMLAIICIGYNIIYTTSLFHDTCCDWHCRCLHPGPKTFATFKAHFSHHNANCHMTITTQSAGYHGAHATTMPPILPPAFTPTQHSALLAIAIAATLAPQQPPHLAPSLIHLATMGWCWTHGLSYNLSHTSYTCHKECAEGHQEAATYENRMGGSTCSARFPPCPRE